MEIEIAAQMSTRPCRFRLCLQGGSVFADFDVDPDGRVYAVRVSFDGYGCCHAPAGIGRLSLSDSALLLAMVRRGSVDPAAARALRTYFRENADALWRDALARHELT